SVAKLLGTRACGVVEESAMDTGDGDAVDLVAVVLVQRADVVYADALAVRARANRYGHLDRTARDRPELPQGDRRPMTEDRVRTGGQHRRHPPALDREPRVADRIHAAVQQVEMAASDQPVDLVSREPELEQLPAGDHAVLSLGQRREPPRTCVILTRSTRAKIALGGHEPSVNEISSGVGGGLQQLCGDAGGSVSSGAAGASAPAPPQRHEPDQRGGRA